MINPSFAKKRSIAPEVIPKDMWHEDKLWLPPLLYEIYLKEQKLIKEEIAAVPGKPQIGGASRAETILHFRDRFETSAGRTCAAFLDPRATFWPLSNYLPEFFSDGDVSILEAPCGTGASGLAIIAMLTFLRERSVLPSLPLTIRVFAADVSQTAIDIYKKMLDAMSGSAAKCGISIVFDSSEWDALNAVSTARLCTRALNHFKSTDETIILISNFSGAGSKEDFFSKLNRSYELICARFEETEKPYATIWIEPGRDNKGAVKLFKRIFDFVKHIARFLVFRSSTVYADAHYDYQQWKASEQKFVSSGVRLIRIDSAEAQ